MAGLSQLYDIYKQDPKYVEDLLKSEIEVEEKLNGSRFSFEIDDNREMHFFKRSDSSPISYTDRTITSYYEKAISHFENLSEEQIDQIPVNWRFGFEYFPNLRPVKITYTRMPLNSLVLTDISVKNKDGKNAQIITDEETVSNWAEILNVEKLPILFKGRLSQEQLREIQSYLDTPEDQLEDKFSTINFAKFFISILKPELENSFMQDSLDKEIEALIFKFNGKNSLKISNPNYKKTQKTYKPSDIYSLTLVFFQEFFQQLDFKTIFLKEHTFEERYIEFMCKVFNLFCKSLVYKNNYEDQAIDFELPDFLTSTENKINYDFIKNAETLELLKKSETNRQLFKIMLASMRAHKKKPIGFFRKELLDYHNDLVNKIADYISYTVNEDEFVSFEEYKRLFLTNESKNCKFWEEFGLLEEEEHFPLFKNENSEKQSQDVLIKNFNNITKPSSKNQFSEKVSLIILGSSPFQNSLINLIKQQHEKTGLKMIVCFVGNLFSDSDAIKDSFKVIMQIESSIEYIIQLQYPIYENLLKVISEKQKTVTNILCDNTFYEDFKMQTKSDVQYININIPISEILYTLKIEDGYTQFCELTPEETHSFYYKLKEDLKK